MKCPTLSELPPPPPGKTGWPWSEDSPQLPEKMADGSEWPRISIVTPSYNQGQFIEETIRSVLLQGYPNLEYIIIDGGSTDDSVKIIEKYEKQLTYWVSEPDKGQVNAINKGLNYASGDIFNWINSDDFLNIEALANIANNFGEADALAGACRNFYDTQDEEDAIVQNSNLGVNKIIGSQSGVYHQPGVWLRPQLIELCHGIDENFHYCFDGDLMLRYLALYPKVKYISDVLVNFRFHENSKTIKSRQEKNYFFEDYISTLKKITSLEQFKQLHSYCYFRLRQINWIKILNQIREDSNISSWKRRIKIISLVFEDPKIRISRMTLGALRRC